MKCRKRTEGKKRNGERKKEEGRGGKGEPLSLQLLSSQITATAHRFKESKEKGGRTEAGRGEEKRKK